MDGQDGELLIRIDERLQGLTELVRGYRNDIQHDIDEIWTAIDRTRADVTDLQSFKATVGGAGRSLNWMTHLLISLPFGAIAGAVGFFVSK